jgi:hypothetical protein
LHTGGLNIFLIEVTQIDITFLVKKNLNVKTISRSIPQSIKRGTTDICVCVCTSIIHNSQKTKATRCPSMDSWEGKAVHAYSGIVFSFKKEGNSDRCCNMDEP